MTELEIKNGVSIMFTMATEIDSLLAEGWSLKQISSWSYQLREEGGSYPYLSVSQVEGKKVVELRAAPTVRQTLLRGMFDLVAPEHLSLPMFEFIVSPGKVEFLLRASKTEKIQLYTRT